MIDSDDAMLELELALAERERLYDIVTFALEQVGALRHALDALASEQRILASAQYDILAVLTTPGGVPDFRDVKGLH